MTEISKPIAFEVTKASIDQMRTEYSGLNIIDMDDKEGYKKVDEARKFVKKIRLGIDAKRKELNEAALKHQRDVNAAAKTLTELITPIETALEEKQTVIDNAKKKIEQERIQKLADRYKGRATKLTAQGMQFDGTHFKLDHLIWDTEAIHGMEDPEFKDCLDQATAIFTLKEEERKSKELELENSKKEATKLKRQMAKMALAKFSDIKPEEMEAVIDKVVEAADCFKMEIDIAADKIVLDLFPPADPNNPDKMVATFKVDNLMDNSPQSHGNADGTVKEFIEKTDLANATKKVATWGDLKPFFETLTPEDLKQPLLVMHEDEGVSCITEVEIVLNDKVYGAPLKKGSILIHC